MNNSDCSEESTKEPAASSESPLDQTWFWFQSLVDFRRKAQRYERWPQQQRTTRSSDSPAATMIRGRSRMSKDSII